MARGIERRRIFQSDGDRRRFVDRLAKVVCDGNALLYAWSLLPNHIHLMLRTGPTGLSLLMHRLLTGYAVTFNRRHNRCGHLFQNRFKSTLVDDATYLLELIRYVHLNPIRAGVLAGLDELDGYRWTGHAALVGTVPPPPWQNVATVLEQFDSDPERARWMYRRFLSDGLAEPSSDHNGDGFVRNASQWQWVPSLKRGREAWAFAERILGTAAFTEALNTTLAPVSPSPPRSTSEDVDVDVTRLVADVATCLKLSPQQILGSGRSGPVVNARACLAYILVRQRGFSLTRTALALGGTKWSINRALQRSAALPADPRTRPSELLQVFDQICGTGRCQRKMR